MEQREQELYIGALLGGRYRIDKHLGSGNFSGVFSATDNQTSTEVAVKVLSLQSTASASAKIELDDERGMLQDLAGASHVVNLLDHGSHPLAVAATHGGPTVEIPIPYLILERADACLANLLLHRARLPWSVRLQLYRDVVKGVHQMHINQIVHRDVKADNGLVYAKPQCAKIADLGRSKDTSTPPRFVTEAYEAGRGDLRFAPPELVWRCGTEDPFAMAASDLFLLGSLQFEFATGVGITALALGDPLSISAALQPLPRAAREMDFKVRHPELRERFEQAYALFRRELPPYLRDPALRLLRQLTDPDPARRRPRAARRTPPPLWDLQWLLNKIDILLKIDAYASRPTKPKKRPTG